MTTPPAPENALCLLFSRITAALRIAIEHDLVEFGVTAHQWPVLLLTHSGRASRPSELASLIGIDRGAVTRLVDRLEEKGLVTRADDPGDLRAARILLTERGATLVPLLQSIVSARYEATLAHIEPADRDRMMAMLNRLDTAIGPGNDAEKSRA